MSRRKRASTLALLNEQCLKNAGIKATRVAIPRKLEIEQYIAGISFIPDIIANQTLGVKFGSYWESEEGFLMEAARLQFRAISLWLKYFILNCEDALTELQVLGHRSPVLSPASGRTMLEQMEIFKPLAEMLKAKYQLSQAILVEVTKQPNLCRWPDGMLLGELLFRLALEMGIAQAEGSFGGEVVPSKQGMHAAMKEHQDFIAELPDKITGQATQPMEVGPTEFIESTSTAISSRSNWFKYHYHKPYTKEMKRCTERLRRSQAKPVCLSSNGGLDFGGTGKRGKAKKKGFATALQASS